MAYIDKIYGTQREYETLRAFLDQHAPNALTYLYAADGYGNHDRPIASFPERIDRWLWLHPKTPRFVKERLTEQYGEQTRKAWSRKGNRRGFAGFTP